MRILFVIDSLGTGGAEKSTELLSYYLLEKGWEVAIAVLKSKNQGVENDVIERGIPVHTVKGVNFLERRKTLAKLIRTYNPDIVHSSLIHSNVLVRSIRMMKKFLHTESLVNTPYDDIRMRDKRINKGVARLVKLVDSLSAVRFVDRFHAITQTVKEHYVNHLGIKSEKVAVVYRGRKPIDEIHRDEYAAGMTLKVLNIGRHEFQKGQIHLLHAVHILKQKGVDVHCTILGREGNMSKELKAYVEGNDLYDRVEFSGYHTNILPFLASAHLFVFPSLFEGLGGSLIEAQAAGLPVACSDIPVLHEVANAGFNAIFFERENPGSIADAISFFIENPDKLKEFGKNSLVNFRNNFVESENHSRLERFFMESIRDFN